MEYLVPLLAAYGICFGLMNEKLERFNRVLYRIPFRRGPEPGTNFFSRMLECAYCTGFHAGWMVWLVWRVGGEVSVVEGMLFPFASSAFCYMIDTLLTRLEE
jgi:hypothetical protein